MDLEKIYWMDKTSGVHSLYLRCFRGRITGSFSRVLLGGSECLTMERKKM